MVIRRTILWKDITGISGDREAHNRSLPSMLPLPPDSIIFWTPIDLRACDLHRKSCDLHNWAWKKNLESDKVSLLKEGQWSFLLISTLLKRIYYTLSHGASLSYFWDSRTPCAQGQGRITGFIHAYYAWIGLSSMWHLIPTHMIFFFNNNEKM